MVLPHRIARWGSFVSGDAFAIRAQRNRRNLTEADILRCIETLDKRMTAGRPAKEFAPEGANLEPAPPVRSSRKTAELLGISPRQVERARTIIDHAPGAPVPQETPHFRPSTVEPDLQNRATSGFSGAAPQKSPGPPRHGSMVRIPPGHQTESIPRHRLVLPFEKLVTFG
jgi:hypothetical protein